MAAVVKVGEAIDVLVFLLELCLPLGGPEQLHVLGQVSEDFWRGIASLVERGEGERVQVVRALEEAVV